MVYYAIALAASSKSFTKDEWLAAFEKLAPVKMCQKLVDDPKTNKLLINANINFDKCVTLIPASFDKCKTKFYPEFPDNINDKNVLTWSNKLGKCIGIDFFSNNLAATFQSPSATPTPTSSSNNKTR